MCLPAFEAGFVTVQDAVVGCEVGQELTELTVSLPALALTSYCAVVLFCSLELLTDSRCAR